MYMRLMLILSFTFLFGLSAETGFAQSTGVRSYVVRSGNSYVRRYVSSSRAPSRTRQRHPVTQPKQFRLGNGSSAKPAYSESNAGSKSDSRTLSSTPSNTQSNTQRKTSVPEPVVRTQALQSQPSQPVNRTNLASPGTSKPNVASTPPRSRSVPSSRRPTTRYRSPIRSQRSFPTSRRSRGRC